MNASEDKLRGDELAQANRDRTASQHVSLPVDQVNANTAALQKQDRTNDIQDGKIQVTNLRIDEDRVNINTTAEKLKGDELAQANRDRTASQHVAAVVGHDGANGKDGKDGKEGVTTTITKVETDSATQDQVKTNSGNIARNSSQIRTVRSEQLAQGEHIQQMDQVVSQNSTAIRSNAQHIDRNSQLINRNSQRIDQNHKEIQDTREDLKRGLNNAAAMTGLHYHSNDAYAISAGTANGDGAALAGGLSHSVTEHTAATVQGSTSMDGSWMASVGFSGDF